MNKTVLKVLDSPILLGTAGWGQKISKSEAYRIVEIFYKNNFRWVDTATNYPINGKPENYGQTVDWLSEFCNDFPELKVFVKVGSASNLGDSINFVNASYLALIFDLLLSKLNSSLGGIGIHWDNENEDSDRTSVINHFLNIHERGFAIGLSGILRTQNYATSRMGRNLPWIVQSNISPIRTTRVAEDIALSRTTFPQAKVYGYNIFGGIKAIGLPKNKERLPYLYEMIEGSTSSNKANELELFMNRFVSLNLDGLIIGPTTEEQCGNWCTIIDRFGLV